MVTNPTEPVTAVIFRVFKDDGSVIALFPYLPGTYDDGTCDSYMHVGQHGSASPDIVSSTRPATAEEYAPLQRELESYPYNYRLRVLRRFPRNAYQVRQAALPRA